MRWVGGSLPEIVGTLFDAAPIASAVVAGGDINEAYRIRLDGGTTVFVKAQAHAPDAMFAREADGLRWLGETNTVRVPRVLAVRDDRELVHRFLVLEWIDSAPAAPDHDERLGRALAELHAFGAPRFGGDADNYIGSLPQANLPVPAATPAATAAGATSAWAEFYATRRLEPLVRRAVDHGRLPPDLTVRFDALRGRLDELVGPPEPPARLHGDLWAGNALTDERGHPVLVDPAAYGGHREVDLAMMRLFGGFGTRVFAAYDERFPLAAGHEDRVLLYQLYPLLVHVNLFGGGYAASVVRALDHYR